MQPRLSCACDGNSLDESSSFTLLVTIYQDADVLYYIRTSLINTASSTMAYLRPRLRQENARLFTQDWALAWCLWLRRHQRSLQIHPWTSSTHITSDIVTMFLGNNGTLNTQGNRSSWWMILILLLVSSIIDAWLPRQWFEQRGKNDFEWCCIPQRCTNYPCRSAF